VNDRFVLTNRAAGDIGVAIEDVTGNFVAASGLATGTLDRGKNLVYTVNGSGDLTSQSNAISSDSSGVTGLSVTVLKEGSFSITVNSDVAKIKTAITDFITEYNKTQSLIQTNTASSTDAKGVVSAGILASDSTATEISGKLRRMISGDISGLTGVFKRLESLGFSSNGNDDTLAIGNTSKLDDALANNLAGVKDLFTNGEKGLANSLEGYLKTLVGDDGSLAKHQSTLTTQSGNIDKQIAEMERWVLVRRQQMIDSFVAMESAQQKINQQLSFLQQQQQQW
jgi:flagellar hook-associated protein 2